ncbi:sulfatase [Candidatus Hydrogenedentota bacterium]
MNFIVVMLDTLRADHLGAYGGTSAKTPNMDKFASTAMRFGNAHIASWPTIPNRTDLFTGRYGEPFHGWEPLSYMDVTLPEVFRKAGYATQLIHDTPHLINYGFGFDRPFNCWWMIRGNEVDRCWTDHHFYKAPCRRELRKTERGDPFHQQSLRNVRNRSDHEEDRFCAQVMTSASKWLQDNYKNEDFFLWIDCFDPHEPWDPPQKYIDMYDPDFDGEFITNFFDAKNATPREIKHVCARYAAMVTMVDTWIGKLFTQIEQLGIAENTAVILMSDHGTGLCDHEDMHKNLPIYDEVSRLVFMMRVPGVTTANSSSDVLVQPPDLMPTILELTGLEADYEPHGISLVPTLKGEKQATRYICVSGTNPKLSLPLTATVNDGEWTYIFRPEPNPDELYCTSEDKKQQNNVIEAHPAEAKRLRKAMLRHFETTVDTPEWLMEFYRTGRESIARPKPARELERRREQSLHQRHFLQTRFKEID